MRWLALVAIVLCGCPSDSGEDTPGSTGMVDPTTGGAGSSGSDSSGGPVGSTGPGLVWPPDDGLNTCTQECDGPWDCCPASAMGQCPGDYPYNYDCINGFCVPGSCAGDGECAGGEVCRPVDGVSVCVTTCADDPTCAAVGDTLSCAGQTDDGESYCIEHCDAAGIFCGNATCDPVSGRCVCESGQCLAGWSCV